ncbi:venom acid phosphatase Acph-1-like [Cylas formicarius]|uniref:venom acid phosphatase Acph-1-like n=1 Tax=Cylas formicarius TaxID=197179 RepID=UPI0029588FD7|nr:venom acid phosphatase Acph-1-like [Cylas formicarius]
MCLRSVAFVVAVAIFAVSVMSLPHDNWVGHRAWKSHFEKENDDFEEDLFGESLDTVVLSHVLFRHGNRTPDSIQELYPNDPYLNETYYPYGLGQLTNAGKLKEFNIGVSLRKRYESFLGDTYLHETVEAISTDYNRTKASLQLALAGLFPPKAEQVWNNDLPWQPVPYNFLPRAQDNVLLGVLCPNYLRQYERVVNSAEMKKKLKKHKQTLNYISKHSGLNVTRFQDIYNLYFGLSTEEEYGLVLPAWTRKVWPDAVVNLAIEEYYVSMATDELIELASGYFLRKVLEDTLVKIYGNANSKKIYLYSAHENNVAQLLMLLDVFTPHIPNYGAYVIMEVHKINGVFGFKIFYENYTGNGPRLLRIPSCGDFCPFERFIQLYRKYIPKDDNCGN